MLINLTMKNPKVTQDETISQWIHAAEIAINEEVQDKLVDFMVFGSAAWPEEREE